MTQFILFFVSGDARKELIDCDRFLNMNLNV